MTAGPAPGEVHAWRIDVDRISRKLRDPDQWISPDERIRASKLHLAHDRRGLVASRAALRMLLAHYLGTNPGDIRFRYGAHGKPTLAGPSPFRFSQSHREGQSLLVVTLDREIGVDLERIRLDLAFDEIAERVFSAADRARLRDLAAETRVRAFFIAWTALEAEIKARGQALSMADRTCSRADDDGAYGAKACRSLSFVLWPRYVAGVAVLGEFTRITLKTFAGAESFAGATGRVRGQGVRE